MADFKTCATATSVTDSGATELVVLTLNPTQYAFEVGSGIYVSGSLTITSAASGTSAVVVKVRRGSSISGTLIVTQTVTATTGTKYVIPFDAFDNTGGETSTSTYVVTVTETAATANGTVNVATAKMENVTP